MHRLILRVLLDEASEAEERTVERWRRSSAANDREYRDIALLYELRPGLLPDGNPPARPTLDEIVGRAEARSASTRPAVRRRWHRWALAAAAAVVALIGVALFGPDGDLHVGAAEISTTATETVTVTLDDGTFVRLAPGSRLSFQRPNGEAGVWLEGRAYFAVAPDGGRRFVVGTAAGDVEVLGTRFELSVDTDTLRVVVTDGEVAFHHLGDRVSVRAGEISRVSPGSQPEVFAVQDVREAMDWPGGILVFQSTPLRRVASDLEHHFGIRVEVADSALMERTLTGWFQDESLEEVLGVVCRVTRTACELTNGTVTIERP